MTRRQRLLRIVLPLFILALGVVGMRLLILSRQAPPKLAMKNPGLLVEVLRAQPVDHPVAVVGTGTVQSRQEVAITPQVSGRIVALAPGFQAGGFFRKGELLFAIEAVDYQLALQRASAALARAEVDQALVEGQARVAAQEWDRLNPGTEAPPLVLQQPQLKNAEAALAAARAGLEQARLDLARTRIEAPFDCRVRSEEVALGQYVRAGAGVALVAGTEAVEIVVPLPLEELGWLRIPRAGSAGPGSPARAPRLSGAGETPSWQGQIVRSLGEVDSRSRMARVVVAVADPYGIASGGEGPAALEVGMFVEVSLSGATLSQVVALPRSALREGGVVWTVDDEDRLQLQPVTVVRQEGELALVAEGLAAGDRVVLTRISGAAAGLQLRPREPGAEAR